LPPAACFVRVDRADVVVRMAWAFLARFPRSAVASARPVDDAPRSRGVHGWAGRWLVNGSGSGLVSVDLSPEQRAWVLGVPVRLRQLMVSVDDPAGLSRALRPVVAGGERHES
ncbi:MAG TPA: hypothetical protein VE987_03400, partial [Polyangiaceae bacterium]|nr:hypothetical protein [Polyangiaceae bacterium]